MAQRTGRSREWQVTLLGKKFVSCTNFFIMLFVPNKLKFNQVEISYLKLFERFVLNFSK